MMFAALGMLAGVGVAALAVINPERLERLTTFLNPWAQPRDAGFQTIQMLYALGLGGPFGEGLGAGKEKFGYLPHPYTDSIFAVLGDELGLAGTLVIVLLFLALAFRGVRIALRAEDSTGALLATGVTMWLCFQAWVNMAVVASLVPMTGITLPFISYGGSSLCVGLIAVGILLNVGRARTTQRTSVSRSSRRWRDGRTREPAPRGRGSAPRNGSRHQLPLHRWSSRPRG
jgi:cell division protein FtsW